eukprot:1925902-Rhodomonas_salina.2
MLVHGTCNPIGEANDYNGVFLRKNDIERIVGGSDLVGKPVLLEHGGDAVGRVVSAWEHRGALDVVVELVADSFEGSLASTFVASKCVNDFSLGYKVEMTRSGACSGVSVGRKTIVELSLVKKGAREKCHIKNFCRS